MLLLTARPASGHSAEYRSPTPAGMKRSLKSSTGHPHEIFGLEFGPVRPPAGDDGQAVIFGQMLFVNAASCVRTFGSGDCPVRRCTQSDRADPLMTFFKRGAPQRLGISRGLFGCVYLAKSKSPMVCLIPPLFSFFIPQIETIRPGLEIASRFTSLLPKHHLHLPHPFLMRIALVPAYNSCVTTIRFHP